MNIGQVLEIHLSLAAKALGFNVATPIFQGANEHDIQDTLELANDYVNTEDFEEFREKYKDILAPDVMQYLDEIGTSGLGAFFVVQILLESFIAHLVSSFFSGNSFHRNSSSFWVS